MLHRLLALLFPPKCVLCRKLLSGQEMDLCHECRKSAPEFTKEKIKYSFIARWTVVWYYKDTVRKSLLQYKFYHRRSYAATYGRLLAMKLHTSGLDDFDVLTWVPVSKLRKLKRGYDQAEFLARAVAHELGVSATRCLVKIHHNRPQSGLNDAARRRANVLGAYKVLEPDAIRDKRVLILDDIITTGSTISECAKTLCIAGAKEVTCAAVALTPNDKNDM